LSCIAATSLIYRAVCQITTTPVILSAGKAGVEGSTHFRPFLQVLGAKIPRFRYASLGMTALYDDWEQPDKLEFAAVIQISGRL